MRCTRWQLVLCSLVIGASCAEPARVWGQTPKGAVLKSWSIPKDTRADHEPVVKLQPAAAEQVPLDDLPPGVRERVQAVIEHPTLSATGPADEFLGQMVFYQWLLDHPDRAAEAWRRRGAPCLDITERGPNKFGWADTHGSDVSWEMVNCGPTVRIWYAEGHVRPTFLLPPLPGKAVVVMHYRQRLGLFGEPHIQHHADLFVQTDSKTAALVLKLMGPSVPRLTEQCLGQLGIFFSGLTSYGFNHPEKAALLFQ